MVPLLYLIRVGKQAQHPSPPTGRGARDVVATSLELARFVPYKMGPGVYRTVLPIYGEEGNRALAKIGRRGLPEEVADWGRTLSEATKKCFVRKFAQLSCMSWDIFLDWTRMI